ncbi:SDR family oxidoreductase [Fulvivirgaceae bacterium BMA10]|uniref:SDR family oxidoreductase n=1 Tax=Splendidivirga corallicola TaxID=3051826 RepID=A0ABT8KXD4_9BACT|nr:SDR family oxidoreductase [Fulvivirgaceae bacterium BMA10]
MSDLKGKTAIISGGGSGIGKSISTLFASQGVHVHILELNSEASEEVCKEIAADGGSATGHICDIASHQEVNKTIQGIQGNIDIQVNNAGIAHIGNLEGTSEADFDKIFQVNVKGVFNCMQAVIPKMKSQGGGVILNMASVASMVGISDRFAYSMSKGAVLTMTLSVAKDYIKENIRCNCISPARIHTPFVDGFIAKNYPGKEKEMFEALSQTQPIGRMGTPDEVAELALYLCSDKAGFITGTNFPIDGGFVNLNT